MPPRGLASRDRTGAYLISLCVVTAVFGLFFFMTIFVQQVWGYSPVRSGIAKVPHKDTGAAASLLNTGQQVGGAIGLAILGTVAWSAVASNTRSAAAHGAHLPAAAQTARWAATHSPTGSGAGTWCRRGSRSSR